MDIFEYLRELVGCPHISDLRLCGYKEVAIDILKTLDLSIIDQEQIADVSNYFGIALT